MCGIAGVLALTDRPPDPAWAGLLVRAMSHRGPDGSGTHADQRLVLAHARLAILDLSEAGGQPMWTQDRQHGLVLNGEIYNHATLRTATPPPAGGWHSSSDTEVLLERLARGGDTLTDLRGMFAFAHWDQQRAELTLVRDRLGKKPLLWVRTPEYFAFASEAATLLALPFVRARLDRRSLAHWMRFLYAPAPHTMLEGMHRLPPGHSMRISPREHAGEPRFERWWQPPIADPDARADAAWFDQLDTELLEATRLRTVSDVPIGVFLSGGLDSNLVLATLRRTGHAPIRTFTVGFRGLPDERERAREGATRYAHEHTELELEPDLVHELPAILDHFGDPLGDSAVVTTALIAREAAKHVKVILNGDGGDELFGGYARYPFAHRVDLFRGWPGGSALLSMAARSDHQRAVLAALHEHGPAAAAQELGAVCPTDVLTACLAPGGPGPHPLPGMLGFPADRLTPAVFGWDTGTYLPDDLLVKVDIASMAFGLENRSPLLDHRLFEHVGRLPVARRTDARRTKPLLRRLAQGRVPDSVLSARKQGFQLPLDAWLRGPLAGWLEELVPPRALAPLFRLDALAVELDRFRRGESDANAAYRLWGLAVLEHWARRFNVEVDAR